MTKVYNNLQGFHSRRKNLENEQFSVQGISLSVRAIKAIKLVRSRPCVLSQKRFKFFDIAKMQIYTLRYLMKIS